MIGIELEVGDILIGKINEVELKVINFKEEETISGTTKLIVFDYQGKKLTEPYARILKSGFKVIRDGKEVWN